MSVDSSEVLALVFLGLEWIYSISIFVLVVIIITERRNPLRAIAWILILIALPGFGLVAYVLFGRSLRRQKLSRVKAEADRRLLEQLKARRPSELEEATGSRARELRHALPLMELLHNNSRAFLARKNRIVVLRNGSETFPAMIAAIQKARSHIHLESYIIEDDALGRRVRDLLIEQARAGVEVRLIYDDIGSWDLSSEFVEGLRSARVEVQSFMPVFSVHFPNRANFRNHRKLLIVDGRIGFIGGLNIGQSYLSGDPTLGPWRDTHLMIEGQAVQGLQGVFLSDWQFVSDEAIEDHTRFFPTVNWRGDQWVQVVASGPDSEWASIMQAHFAAIMLARRYAYISTPYFLPNESILNALKTQALSGVDVRLILPATGDHWIVHHASLSYVDELLDAGVRVFFYKEGFHHAKVLVTDDFVASVGTANMDIRSFEHNFEATAFIYDRRCARTLRKQFEKDLEDSEEAVLERVRNWPRALRLSCSVARLFSPLL